MSRRSSVSWNWSCEHAVERPDESLGVIAMGIEHAQRIQMALDARARTHPELDASSTRPRGAVLRQEPRARPGRRARRDHPLDRVRQERAGRLLYRFGPLLQEGGERRLNVAITRARQRMTLVSSFSHDDMRPDYPKWGCACFASSLEYAATAGRLGAGTATEVALTSSSSRCQTNSRGTG